MSIMSKCEIYWGQKILNEGVLLWLKLFVAFSIWYFDAPFLLLWQSFIYFISSFSSVLFHLIVVTISANTAIAINCLSIGHSPSFCPFTLNSALFFLKFDYNQNFLLFFLWHFPLNSYLGGIWSIIIFCSSKLSFIVFLAFYHLFLQFVLLYL